MKQKTILLNNRHRAYLLAQSLRRYYRSVILYDWTDHFTVIYWY